MTFDPNSSMPGRIGLKRVITQSIPIASIAAQALRQQLRRADETRAQRIHHAVARVSRAFARLVRKRLGLVLRSQTITCGLMA